MRKVFVILTFIITVLFGTMAYAADIYEYQGNPVEALNGIYISDDLTRPVRGGPTPYVSEVTVLLYELGYSNFIYEILRSTFCELPDFIAIFCTDSGMIIELELDGTLIYYQTGQTLEMFETFVNTNIKVVDSIRYGIGMETTRNRYRISTAIITISMLDDYGNRYKVEIECIATAETLMRKRGYDETLINRIVESFLEEMAVGL